MQLEKLDIYLERISDIFYFVLKRKTQMYKKNFEIIRRKQMLVRKIMTKL